MKCPGPVIRATSRTLPLYFLNCLPIVPTQIRAGKDRIGERPVIFQPCSDAVTEFCFHAAGQFALPRPKEHRCVMSRFARGVENCAGVSQDGCLVTRLGMEEVLLMDSIKSDNPVVNTLEKTWLAQQGNESEPMGYPLPRQDSHACFGLTGEKVSHMFAKLCAVDLRPQKFSNLSIAQTSIARIASIVIRNDLSGACTYLLLTDSASAEYLWDCLIDAMQEFDGQVVGCSNFDFLAT